MKQHGANQTSGLGRNPLTAFSPSIPPNRIAPRVGANPEQSAISTVSLDRADRQNLEASAIFILLLDRLLFPSQTPQDRQGHRFSAKWTKEERTNSLKLEAVMKKHGFIPFTFEWWHYDYVGWEKYPPLGC